MQRKTSVGLNDSTRPTTSHEAGRSDDIQIDDLSATVQRAQAMEIIVQSPATEEVTVTWSVLIKLLSCSISFFCAGVDNGSLGTLIPYFARFYNISLGSVAVVYGSSFAGWCFAGAINSEIMQYLGFGTILTLGASFQLLAQCLRCWNPPWGIYCFGYFLSSLGLAFQDSQSNTYVSTFKGAHRWLGLIHALYSVGMVVAPFAANGIAAQNPERWSQFYFVPLALDMVNFLMVLTAFRGSLRRSSTTGQTSAAEDSTLRNSQRESRSAKMIQRTLKPILLPGVWQLSLWFFFYAGAATTQNGTFQNSYLYLANKVVGWLVEFLVTVRGGELAKMGYVPTAAFGGGALGRLLLPEVFHRLGERRSVLVCHSLWIALQIVVLTVPNIPITIAVVTLMGFFAGPFFPTAISVGSKVFPTEQKPAALGFVFIASQAGGALFPTLTGLIADRAGVKVLQPIAIGLMAVAACTWLLIPRAQRRTD